MVSLVFSYLDFAKALLIGIPECQRLQRERNRAAKLVVQGKFVDTQQAFKYVQWLPIKLCIQFKVLLLCFLNV